jgi:hypothetical protein
MLMTERTPTESIRPYKRKLLLSMEMKEEDKRTRQDLCEQTLELRKRAYDRVQILVDVYNDTEFRLEYGNRDDAKLGDILDVYADDLGYKFHDLRVMLQEYPNRDDWGKYHRADMKQHVDSLGKKDQEDSKPPVVRIKQADLKRQLAEAETLRKHEAAKRIAAERRLEEIQRQSRSTPIPQYEPKPHSNGTNGHSKPPFASQSSNGQAKRPVVEREPCEPRTNYERDVVDASPVAKPKDELEAFLIDMDEFLASKRKEYPHISLDQVSPEIAKLLIKRWK